MSPARFHCVKLLYSVVLTKTYSHLQSDVPGAIIASRFAYVTGACAQYVSVWDDQVDRCAYTSSSPCV